MLLANRRNGPLLEGPFPDGLMTGALARSSRFDPRILTFLVGALMRFRPEIIHSHNYEANTWARFLGLLAPRSGIVCHMHGSRFIGSHPGHRIWLDRVLFHRANAVIAVNRIQTEYLQRHLRVPGHKIHFIQNGIDIRRLRPPSETAGNPLGVVCVASLTEVKNHANLLRAWKIVHATFPDARLTLVGDGPLHSALQDQAHESGIANTVAFTGTMTDVRKALWEASIFVLPSDSEALPLALLEAMAAGLACVATNVGGVPEVLHTERLGRVVPPREPDALAAALMAFLSSPEQARSAGRLAQQEAMERYDLESCADRIEAVYRTSTRFRMELGG